MRLLVQNYLCYQLVLTMKNESTISWSDNKLNKNKFIFTRIPETKVQRLQHLDDFLVFLQKNHHSFVEIHFHHILYQHQFHLHLLQKNYIFIRSLKLHSSTAEKLTARENEAKFVKSLASGMKLTFKRLSLAKSRHLFIEMWKELWRHWDEKNSQF